MIRANKENGTGINIS